MNEAFSYCKGTQGNMYRLFLKVEETEKSYSENKAILKFTLYLTASDSSDKYHSFIENDNTVWLKVNGVTVLKENLKIDTRNENQILATYSGCFPISSINEKKVSISGEFTTTSTELSGGDVSMDYILSKNIKVSTAIIPTDDVYPLSTINYKIDADPTCTHKISWCLGTKAQTQVLTNGVIDGSFTIPYSWTRELTDSSYGKMFCVLDTYYLGNFVGSKSYILRFVIPDKEEFLPSCRIFLEPLNGISNSGITEYLTGEKKIKVSVNNCQYKEMASYSSCEIIVGKQVKMGCEGIFDLPNPGDVTIKVILKDSRGKSFTTEKIIHVEEYVKPYLEIYDFYRCNSLGEPEVSGSYFIVDFSKIFSSINGKNKAKATFKYRSNAYEPFSNEIELGEDLYFYDKGDLDPLKSYEFQFKITDSIDVKGSVTEKNLLLKALSFNIKKGGNGASFGKTSEVENALDVNWDFILRGEADFKKCFKNQSFSVDEITDFTVGFSDCKYFRAINMGFLNLKLILKSEIPKNKIIRVGKVNAFLPNYENSLSAYIDNSASSAFAGVNQQGEINIYANNNLPVGTNLVLNGFYNCKLN